MVLGAGSVVVVVVVDVVDVVVDWTEPGEGEQAATRRATTNNRLIADNLNQIPSYWTSRTRCADTRWGDSC